MKKVGDLANEGTSNIAVIDADSFWIDGSFEETSMERVCGGTCVAVTLMGYE